jgi:anthranilate phosphoribosyltransferase
MEEFRELLKKVGSGTHTSQSLSRSEAAMAMRKMLLAEATPAQIGAFFIAHRIRRPTGEELAGMLDAWQELGPQIPAIPGQPVRVLGIPYDGRSRTAPVSPITALLLAAAEVPVLMHGGDRMPTKYGVPLVDLWRDLGIDWSRLTLAGTQEVLAATGIGFVYTPRHFPKVYDLVAYREQIGKRPPIATLELIWTPYAGPLELIFGYVHPPTEKTALVALGLRDLAMKITTVKGLEGSCDLPHDRTTIVGTGQADELERILIHHQDYGVSSHNPTLTENLGAELAAIAQGQTNHLAESVLWNGGFYLWHCGAAPDLKTGMEEAKELLISGKVRSQLAVVSKAVAKFSSPE